MLFSLKMKELIMQEQRLCKCSIDCLMNYYFTTYLSSKRYRRSTGDCVNGTIPASTQSSALKGPPRAKLDGSAKTGYLDHQTSFKCTVFSNLSASVTWLFNGKALISRGKGQAFIFVLQKAVGNQNAFKEGCRKLHMCCGK